MKTNNAVLRKIQLRQVNAFQETKNNSKTTKIQTKKETNYIFRRSIPHVEKPAHLVARGTDSTSVQRRYRAAWRPNEYYRTICTARCSEQTRRQTQSLGLGEAILTAVILLVVVTPNSIESSRNHRSPLQAPLQAGSLLLCLGAAVYILLNFIITNTYILDYLLLIIKMAMCSFECSTGIALAIFACICIIFGIGFGIALDRGFIWWFSRKKKRPKSIHEFHNLDDAIIHCLSERITDYDTLRSLGVQLKVKLHYIQRLQSAHVGIWEASSEVLMQWSDTQDSLTPESSGLQTLKSALRSIEKIRWIREIDQVIQEYQSEAR